MTALAGSLADLVRRGKSAATHRPWRRVAIDEALWREISHGLARGLSTLLGLWGEEDAVHMALLDAEAGEVAIFSLDCPSGIFPSVGRAHKPAIRLERTIHDLIGLAPHGARDGRPWLDHGRWRRSPSGRAGTSEVDAPYRFLAVEGDGLHQIPVGPVHAGIIEPGHFRFTTNGETVVRLEERLGYAHKGTQALMCNASLDHASRLAGRVSGDSTVAYAFAFARAAEAALDLMPPPRAVWLRALMAEIERLANHLGDIGAICNDASFALMQAHCGILRERVLRAAHSCFGHRLMMDRIVVGGLAVDADLAGLSKVQETVAELRRVLPSLIKLYDNTTSLQDRTVGTGIVTPELAREFGCGGPIGRASGRAFDARRNLAYPPYDQLDFTVALRSEGDVNARVWIRFDEVAQSLGLVEQILANLPDGAVRRPIAGAPVEGSCEGSALVEGFRGDILVWLRIDAAGAVSRCHLRDPSWFQWPLLETAIDGNIVADFPLCNKSFNCSYSGHDL